MTGDQVAAGPAAGAAAKSSWVTLIVITIISLLAFVDRHLFAALAEPVKHELALTDTQIGFAMGPAFTIATVVFAIPLGWLGDRISRRLILGGCMIVWSAGMLMAAFADTYGHLVTARVIIGAGEAGLAPLTFSIVADAIALERRAFASAVLSTSNKIGKIVADYTVGLLAVIVAVVAGFGVNSDLSAWRLLTLAVGIPGLIGVVLLALIKEPKRRDEAAAKTTDNAAYVAFLKANRARMLLLLLAFGSELMCLTTMSWTNAYMGRQFGMKPQEAGPILATVSIVAVAASLFMGAFQDWLTSKKIQDAYVKSYFWMVLVGMPFFAIAFVVKSAPLFLVMYPVISLILASALTFLIPTIQAMTPPQFVGRTLGMYFASLHFLGSFGSMGAGMLTDYVFKDPAKLGYAMAIIILLGATSCLICLRLVLKLPAVTAAPVPAAPAGGELAPANA